MSTLISTSDKKNFAARMDTLLQGRRVHPWSASVGLSAATAQRLATGQFPDPEKLVPACRIERLSLTWLIDGLGSPFVVNIATSDDDGARLLRQLIRDEPFQKPVVAHSDIGFSVLLLQPVTVQQANQPAYTYTSIEVIGGSALGPKTVSELTMFQMVDGPPGFRTHEVLLENDEWRALAGGHMGNVPLIGWQRAPGGLLDKAMPTNFAKSIAEKGAWGGAGERNEEEEEVLHLFRGLERLERQFLVRQLRGLRNQAAQSRA